jgi:hypothetical protein
MKKNLLVFAAVGLLVVMFASCSLLMPDVIVGKWQQVSVNGSPTLLLTVAQFTDSTYTTSVSGVTTNTGTWTKSGSAYTLNGVFFGFAATSTTITPIFSNSSNTLSYTDSSGYVEIFNRQ